MTKYVKKPIVIEAIQFNGYNFDELWDFGLPKIITEPYEFYIEIETLEGNARVNIGDFIIKGTETEFYPCKPHIFSKIYEEVKE